MLNQAYRSLGYQQITALNVAVGLTIPAGTTLVLITPEAQAVRWRDDGVDPTAAIGYPLAIGVELQYAAAHLPRLKFIEQALSAKLNISYYGN